MSKISVVRIEPESTLPIRQRVLWPHYPANFSRVEGDENAHHFGAYVDDQLVSVASVFSDNATTVRLRKFATLHDFQGQGIGSAMLTHIFDEMRADGISVLWCDGREAAHKFYERLGFKASGDRFFKKEVAYFRMTKTL